MGSSLMEILLNIIILIVFALFCFWQGISAERTYGKNNNSCIEKNKGENHE